MGSVLWPGILAAVGFATAAGGPYGPMAYLVYAVGGLLVSVLLLFMVVMVIDNWRKEGIGSALALLFTSLIVFPVVSIVDALDNILFKPSMKSRGEIEGQDGLEVGEGDMALIEGLVYHCRQEQSDNSFTYRVRYSLISLDAPPPSFDGDHISADEARSRAGTSGPVYLLTTPSSLGYTQNPISVYYCYDRSGAVLERCLAEVTNTPWNERVTFVFGPNGDVVPKSLHVSPLIDMNRCWRLVASDPFEGQAGSTRLARQMSVSVTVLPNTEGGRLFTAVLRGGARHIVKRGQAPPWWGMLRFGFMPQRVALRIYWQAAKLLAKGVRYCPHPRDISEEKYLNLTREQPPQARQQGVCPGRTFTFREFDESAAYASRTETANDKAGDNARYSHSLPFYDHGTGSWMGQEPSIRGRSPR